MKDDFFVSLELLPGTHNNAPIHYEVKLGGSSKSFYRSSSFGQWNTPPHHYCLYVTALIDKSAPDEAFETV